VREVVQRDKVRGVKPIRCGLRPFADTPPSSATARSEGAEAEAGGSWPGALEDLAGLWHGERRELGVQSLDGTNPVNVRSVQFLHGAVYASTW
jgi:hypothetical protein